MTQAFLVSPLGSLQTYTSDATWNNSSNTIECLGSGASGTISNNTSASAVATGGGAGSYSLINNFSFAVPGTTTASFQIANYAAAVSFISSAHNGTAGNPSWFNAASNPGNGSDNTKCSAAGAAQPTGVGANPQTGGVGGLITAGWGQTKYAGGNGGNSGSFGTVATGGGGAPGPSGAGLNGVTGTAANSATAGGNADNNAAGSGVGSVGVFSNSGAATSTIGGAGTEWETSPTNYGSGGASGGACSGSSGTTATSGPGNNTNLSYGSGSGGARILNTTATVTSGRSGQGIIVLTWTPVSGVIIAFDCYDLAPNTRLAYRDVKSKTAEWGEMFTPLGNVPSAPWVQSFDDYPVTRTRFLPKQQMQVRNDPLFVAPTTAQIYQSFDWYPDRYVAKHGYLSEQFLNDGEGSLSIPPMIIVQRTTLDYKWQGHLNKSQQFVGEFVPQGNVPSAPWVQSFDDYPIKWVVRLSKTQQFTGEYSPLGNTPSAPWVQSFDLYPETKVKRLPVAYRFAGGFAPQGNIPNAPFNQAFDYYPEKWIVRLRTTQQFIGEFVPLPIVALPLNYDYFPDVWMKRLPLADRFTGEFSPLGNVVSAPFHQAFEEFQSQLWLKRIKLSLQPAGELPFYAIGAPPVAAPMNYDEFPSTRVKQLPLSYRFSGEYALRGNTPSAPFNIALDYFPEKWIKRFSKSNQFDGERGIAPIPSAPWVQSFDYFPEEWVPKLSKVKQFTGEYVPLGNVASAPFNVAFDIYDTPKRLKARAEGFVELVTYTLGAPAPVDFWETGKRRRAARIEGFAEFSVLSSFPAPIEQFEAKLQRRTTRSDGFIVHPQFVAGSIFALPEEFSGALQRRKLLPIADKDELPVLYVTPPVVQSLVSGLDSGADVRKRYMSVVMSSAGFDVYQYFVFIKMWSHDNLASLTQPGDSPGFGVWGEDGSAYVLKPGDES